MSQERESELKETWEEIVFPKEIFGGSVADSRLEEVFHLFGLSSLREIKPDPSLKQKILSAILGNPKEEEFLFVRESEESLWKRSAFPGVEFKILNRDRIRQTVTLMIRMQAGAVFPGHFHETAEDCLLVSGDLSIAGKSMTAGDFHRAKAGSKHRKFSTTSGAEFLIVSGESDFSESEKYFS